ncbi:MAG: hypothetical protein ISR65_11325 [Bacteriovoracaceae bacterium]|nr:hypothetical protein [Bacteriovoracaceae bacterium]
MKRFIIYLIVTCLLSLQLSVVDNSYARSVRPVTPMERQLLKGQGYSDNFIDSLTDAQITQLRQAMVNGQPPADFPPPPGDQVISEDEPAPIVDTNNVTTEPAPPAENDNVITEPSPPATVEEENSPTAQMLLDLPPEDLTNLIENTPPEQLENMLNELSPEEVQQIADNVPPEQLEALANELTPAQQVAVMEQFPEIAENVSVNLSDDEIDALKTIGFTDSEIEDMKTNGISPERISNQMNVYKDKQLEKSKTLGKKITGLMVMSMISMVAVSMIAILAYKSCPQAWSVRIYGLSGLAYLAQEMLNWNGFKQALEQSDMGDTPNAQVDSLKSCKEAVRSAAQTSRKKATAALTAGIGFAAASAFALYESTLPPGPATTCEGITGDPTALFQNNNLLNKLESILLPNAHAFSAGDLDKLGIVAGGGIAMAIIHLAKDMMPKVKKMFKQPQTRAILFGAHSMLAYFVWKGFSDVAKMCDDIADEYEGLENALRTRFGGQTSQIKKTISDWLEIFAEFTVENANAAPKGNDTICFKGAGANLKVNASCSCKKTNSCKKAEVPAARYSKLAQSNLLNSTVSLLKKMSDAFYEGNQKLGDKYARRLSKKRKKIQKLNKTLAKQASQVILQKQRQNIDITGQQKIFFSNIQKKLKKDFKKLDKDTKRQLVASSFPIKYPSLEQTSLGKVLKNITKHTSAVKKTAIGNFIDILNERLQRISRLESNGLYEVEDISNKSDSSIFKIISRRYILRFPDSLR